MNTETIIGLSIAVNRIVEALKVNVLERFLSGDMRAQLRAGLALIFSLILGILGAVMLNLNLFADLGNVPAWAGWIVTGLVVGGGSNLVHAVIELMTQLRDLLGARVNVVQSQARVVSTETVSTQTAQQTLKQINDHTTAFVKQVYEQSVPPPGNVDIDMPEAG